MRLDGKTAFKLSLLYLRGLSIFIYGLPIYPKDWDQIVEPCLLITNFVVYTCLGQE